jgi:hypothetical protein
VHTSFHARVIAARLGADGIVTQLRGGVDGPYPIGDVSVWVSEEDAESARELLLADEVEAVFDVGEDGEPWERSRRRPFLLGLSVSQLIAAVSILTVLAGGVVARLVA